MTIQVEGFVSSHQVAEFLRAMILQPLLELDGDGSTKSTPYLGIVDILKDLHPDELKALSAKVSEELLKQE